MRFGDHQPTLTGQVEGHCELDLTIKPSGGADVGRTHLDSVQFPRQGIEETYQSHHNQYDNESNMSIGSTHISSSIVGETESNWIDFRYDAYKSLRVSESSHPAENAPYLISQLGMNLTQIREDTTSNNLLGSFRPESKAINSQISGNFSNSGCRTSMLSHVENAIANGHENYMNPTALQFGHPGTSDGNFLRLGIGGGLETRSNSNFSATEISHKLEEAYSSPYHNYHAQRTAGYHLNLARPTDRDTRLQFTGAGLSNVSRTSTCDGGGLIAGANDLVGSISCSGSQIPQVNMQKDFSFSADCSSGLRQYQNPFPFPYSRTLMSHPGYAVPSPLESQVNKPTYFTSQPVSVQRQNYYGNSSMYVSPEPFSASPIDWQRGHSVRHSQLRKLIPMTGGRQTQSADRAPFPASVEPHRHVASITEGSSTNVINIGSSQTSLQPTGQLFSPQNVSANEAHGYHLFPGIRGFPVSNGSMFQSVVPSPYPRRLGVQPIDFAAARAGPSQTGLGSHINHLDHTAPSGQHDRVMPSHTPKDFPKGHFDSAGQFVAQHQAFPIPHHQSLKRGAIESPAATHPNHRRKITHRPVAHGSVPHKRKQSPTPVPTPTQIPSAPLHIKFQGFDEPPKPSGYNCFLCKRDLTFTAEGPVYQPTPLPAVAVLPCGHAFHDSCLQRITPDDQSKHPTCIPCATGET